jgi:hypothetical protein
MGFDHGTITCRVCALPQPLPEDILEKFAANAAGPIEHATDEPVWGWVSGRFLLENNINEETSKFGSYIHVCLRQTERKIPGSLLTAECRLAELAQMRVDNTDHLNRKQKKAIKEEVRERLLPSMPPALSGIYVAIDPVAQLLYTNAISERQFDLLCGFFAKAVGFDPIPMTPDNLAQVKYDTDPLSVPAVNISPEIDDVNGATGQLGENFLTWLWYFQEENNGIIPPTKLGDFSLLIDGPLTLVAEGAGSFESSLRKGAPTNSAEARAAMLVGKKLRSAKLILARGKGEEWSCTLDASQFVFRGLKLPEGDSLDPTDIFMERMANLDIFRQMIFELFHLYLTIVRNPEKLADYQQKAKKWVQDRAVY